MKIHESDYSLLVQILLGRSAGIEQIRFPGVSNTSELQDWEAEISLDSTMQYDFAMYCFNNTDGTIRWMIPKSSRKPRHLNLYNGSTWKATLYRVATNMLYAVGLASVIADGLIYVKFKSESSKLSFEERLNWGDSALFTGTRGEDRKAVVVTHQKTGLTYTKVSLSDRGDVLLSNEEKTLNQLTNVFESKHAIPKVVSAEKGSIGLSDIKPKCTKGGKDFSTIHADFLEKLYDHSIDEQPLQGTSYWKELSQLELEWAGCHQNQTRIDRAQLNRLSELFYALKSNIQSDISVMTTITHGDFTPWNMYQTSKGLCVYDWELSRPDFPLFYDLFHYQFQQAILVNRLGQDEITRLVQKILDSSVTLTLSERYRTVNVGQYFVYYILHVAAYFIPKYLKRDDLHPQTFWLLNGWEATMEYFVSREPSLHQRFIDPSISA